MNLTTTINLKKPAGNILLLLTCWAFSLLIYAGHSHARFLDYLDRWAFFYAQYGFKGILDEYQNVSLLYVYHFFQYLLFRLAGFHGVVWNAVFTLLHALNALMAARLFSFYGQKLYPGNALVGAWLVAALVVISPYQTEVLAWGPTIHYLLTGFLVLLAVEMTLRFAVTGKMRFAALSAYAFFIGLFTHEMMLMLPLLLFIVLTVSPRILQMPERWWLLYTRLGSLLILPVIIFFVSNKYLLGKWIGHYGASTHLHFSVSGMGSSALKYVAKYLTLASCWPEELKNPFYQFLDTTRAGYLFAAFCMILFAIIMLRLLWPKVQLMLLFFLLFLSSLLPVLNLYFPYWIPIMGDRLGYVASLFFSPFLVTLLFLLPRFVRWILVVLFYAAAGCCLHTHVYAWKKAGAIATALEQNFPYTEASAIFILALPENYKGAPMYRLTEEKTQPLAENIKKRTGKDLNGVVYEVVKYNMMAPDDSVSVEIVNDSTLKVTLSAWGRWFWRYNAGASDYDTDEYSVDVDDLAHSYTIRFKNKKPDALYIYQTGNTWRKVTGF
ncbi:MAG: hypothetical protein KatS3mg031_2452 [Chitinophagales bacterium]|nr:MAG: hypothetical protein KatS3mg031_2452 [Chitinophagales bacterium]